MRGIRGIEGKEKVGGGERSRGNRSKGQENENKNAKFFCFL